MKVTYDAETDILQIILNDVPVGESDEDKPGIILDYDADGNIIGIEILDASQRVVNVHGVEYTITGLRPTV